MTHGLFGLIKRERGREPFFLQEGTESSSRVVSRAGGNKSAAMPEESGPDHSRDPVVGGRGAVAPSRDNGGLGGVGPPGVLPQEDREGAEGMVTVTPNETALENESDEETLDLGLLHRRGVSRGLPCPVPERFLHLPIDDPRIVFREPAMFGAAVLNRQTGFMDITLARHPTMLTGSEKLRMVKYERECTTGKSDYHDQRQKEMVRCPLTSCGHGIIGCRDIKVNVGVHFRANHNELGCRYRVHFQAKGTQVELEHPRQTLASRIIGGEVEGTQGERGEGGCHTHNVTSARCAIWCARTNLRKKLEWRNTHSRPFGRQC